jgi:uncharacterized protein (TIGR03067 family)
MRSHFGGLPNQRLQLTAAAFSRSGGQRLPGAPQLNFVVRAPECEFAILEWEEFMRSCFYLALVGALSFSCPACEKRDGSPPKTDGGSLKTDAGSPKTDGASPKTDAELILGKWQAISGEGKGKMMSPDKVNETKMIITSNSWTFPDPLGEDQFAYQLDSTKNPKEVTFTRKKKVGAGAFAFYDKMLGLYALDGDTLKLCIAAVFEKERPKTLDGKQNWFMVFKREK